MNKAADDLLQSPKRKELPTLPTSVGEVMSRNVVTLSPANSLQEAITLMANQGFRHLVVLEAGAQLAGVISDRDILRGMNRSKDWTTTTVAEVMTRDAVTVRPATPLSDAVDNILTRRINCLPVIDGSERVCGIVTSTDLLKAFQQLQKRVE